MAFKKSLTLLALAAVLLLAVSGVGSFAFHSQTAQAAPPSQTDSGQRTITVTGSGIAYGQPDVVTVALGVQSSNADILAAMDDVTTRIQAVMQAMQAAGVAPEDMRTDNYSIYQDYGQSGSDSSATTSTYNVSMSLNIVVRDTAQVGDLLGQAVNAGANMVNYIQFDIADRAQLQSEARANAVADAKSRADELAGLLGMTVGEPLSVTENSDYYTPLSSTGGSGIAMAEASTPISGGTLSVSLSVTITYELIPAS